MAKTPAQPPLNLSDWATAPLHRVVTTARIDARGALGVVGGLTAKAAAAAATPGVRALAVCEGQFWDAADAVCSTSQPLGETTPQGLRIAKAATVQGLAQALIGSVGDGIYGPVVPLPQVLSSADAGKSFDYRAQSFHAFGWLDARVREALLAPAQQALQVQDLPLGQLCKAQPKGYIPILGTAGCGKTN